MPMPIFGVLNEPVDQQLGPIPRGSFGTSRIFFPSPFPCRLAALCSPFRWRQIQFCSFQKGFRFFPHFSTDSTSDVQLLIFDGVPIYKNSKKY
jgi:hypothetical protein